MRFPENGGGGGEQFIVVLVSSTKNSGKPRGVYRGRGIPTKLREILESSVGVFLESQEFRGGAVLHSCVGIVRKQHGKVQESNGGGG